MTETNSGVWNIPPIWNSQIMNNSVSDSKKFWKPDVSLFDNAPNDVTLWSFFGKVFIWLIVWICVAALLFWTFSISWLTNSDTGTANPLLPILLPIMWFVACFIWNLTLAGLYNLFFSKRYYNFSKMFWLIFVSSLITLPLFIIVYALYNSVFQAKIDVLYVILKFQIIFSLYVSVNLIDFLSQPNYSASSLIWNTLWCALAVVLAIILSWNIVLVTVSAIATYTSVVLWAWIWDAIYYKFYEWWNNPFYLPSLNELREERIEEEYKKAKDEEDVNVDIK